MAFHTAVVSSYVCLFVLVHVYPQQMYGRWKSRSWFYRNIWIVLRKTTVYLIVDGIVRISITDKGTDEKNEIVFITTGSSFVTLLCVYFIIIRLQYSKDSFVIVSKAISYRHHGRQVILVVLMCFRRTHFSPVLIVRFFVVLSKPTVDGA